QRSLSVLLRARTAAWIHAALPDSQRSPADLDPYAWPIPSLGVRDLGRLAPSGRRWLLVGDAAGLVDPITREGIYFAIASGEWAAAALRESGASCETRDRARVPDEAGAELSRAARLKAGFFRPEFTRLMLRALQESRAIRAVMADLVAGTQSYRTLKWRLMQTLEVGLAWKALRRSLG